jgi:hypothetical protein
LAHPPVGRRDWRTRRPRIGTAACRRRIFLTAGNRRSTRIDLPPFRSRYWSHQPQRYRYQQHRHRRHLHRRRRPRHLSLSGRGYPDRYCKQNQRPRERRANATARNFPPSSGT